MDRLLAVLFPRGRLAAAADGNLGGQVEKARSGFSVDKRSDARDVLIRQRDDPGVGQHGVLVLVGVGGAPGSGSLGCGRGHLGQNVSLPGGLQQTQRTLLSGRGLQANCQLFLVRHRTFGHFSLHNIITC